MTYKFIIFDVQIHKLWPKMRFLRRLDNLGNVNAGDKQFEVFHD